MRVRVTALLIILGLLAQGAALVRHHAILLSQALAAEAATVTDPSLRALLGDLLTAICHSDGTDANAALQPAGGSTPDGQPTCPICNGLASVFSLPPPAGPFEQIAFHSQTIEFAAFDERHRTHRFIRPQSRGPPLAA